MNYLLLSNNKLVAKMEIVNSEVSTTELRLHLLVFSIRQLYEMISNKK